MSIERSNKEFNPFVEKQSSSQDKKEFFDVNKEVIVDNNIETADFERVADLSCTYEDLIHFFGEPLRPLGSNNRVEWRFRELESNIGCTIYDFDSDISLEDTFTWDVGGHCNRSLEMVSQIFEQEFRKGKCFKSKPLNKIV